MRQNFNTPIKLGAFAIVFALVAGCENPHLMQLKDEFGWTEAKMVSDGWLKSRAIAQPPVYCYHTLAEADCYSKPKHGHQERLMAPPYEGVF